MSTIALRPRSVSELLDAAIQLLKQHYGQFVVIAGLAYLPIIAVQVASAIVQARTSSTASGELAPATAIMIGITYVVAIVWSAVAEGAMVSAAGDAYLGRGVEPRAALGTAFSRLGSLLGASMLRAFAVGLGAGLIMIPVVLITGAFLAGSPIVGGLIAVVFGFGAVAGLFFIYVGLMVIPAAVVLEGLGASQALGRSWRLLDGLRWKALGAWLLAFLIVMVTAVTVQVAFTIAQMPTVAAIAGSVLQIFVYPLVGIVITLIYYDARIRKEGYDMELMAEQIAAPESAQPVR